MSYDLERSFDEMLVDGDFFAVYEQFADPLLAQPLWLSDDELADLV